MGINSESKAVFFIIPAKKKSTLTDNILTLEIKTLAHFHNKTWNLALKGYHGHNAYLCYNFFNV